MQIGWLWEGEEWSHEAMMAYAGEYPDDFPFTPEMLSAMFQPSERAFISPTMLAQCPRQIALRNIFDYYMDPFKLYAAYRGTIVHHMMEQGYNEPDAILEKRLTCYFTLPDGRVKEIRGQPDKVVPSHKLLIDYKTSDKMINTPKASWVWQLSCYRWMLYQHDIPVDRAFIQLIHMKEPTRIEVPLKSLKETEAYLNARLPLYEGPFDVDRLPPLLDFILDSDMAWQCKPEGVPGGGWCPVYEICMDLARQGK